MFNNTLSNYIMNEIKRDGNKTFLNLNEFRFNQFGFTCSQENIKEYYKSDLTAVVAKKLATMYGTSPDRIMLVNGGDAGIDVLIRFFRHMDAIIKVPTYGKYKTLCELHNVNYREMLHLPDAYSNNLVFICNPNNPTGEYIDIGSIAYNNPSSIFVVDETYIEFSDHKSMIGNLSNVYVIRSMSKYYGLAGMRIGCIVGDITMRHTFNDKNVLDISKKCVLRVLDNKKYYDDCSKELKKNKMVIARRLGLKRNIIDTQCNFICVEGIDDLSIADDHGLVFRDISTRPTCENMYRITIGNMEDTEKTLRFISSL